MISLVCALSSPTPAEGCPSLFGWFTGTAAQSDFSGQWLRNRQHCLTAYALRCLHLAAPCGSTNGQDLALEIEVANLKRNNFSATQPCHRRQRKHHAKWP